MGLLIWIPFVHGDCKNQGTLNVETSTVGTITYTTGKFGKAVQIGTGTQVTNGININSNLVEELGDEYSCSVWVKPAGNHVHYDGAIISSGNWNSQHWSFGLSQNNQKVSLIAPGHSQYVNCPVPIGEWTHLVCTCVNKVVKLYKNGEYIATATFAKGLESNATNTTIGRETYANGYFGFNGCIEDIRVYNHCLSPEEIKHLSQGLTIHYPLSNRGFGGDNLLRNSHVKLDNSGYYVGTYAFADSSKLVTGKTYTLSFNGELQDDSQTGWYFNIFPSPYTMVIRESTAKEGRFAFSFVMPENGGNRTSIGCYSLPLGNYKGCAIWNVKLEEGDHATPWIPNSSDPLYSSLGLDSTAELDCSGYQYNGIKNNVTNDTDSPVNKGCYVFNGTNSWIKCDTNEWMVQGATELTINEWAYAEDWTKQTNAHLFSCTESGGFNTESAGSGYLRFPRHVYTNEAKSSLGYQMSNTAINLADLTPGWHMFTFIYNTSGDKIYIDGELYSSYNVVSYGLHFNTNARLYLGCEASTAKPAAPYFNGKLSDFRLYYTELDEDEIKELYRMGV